MSEVVNTNPKKDIKRFFNNQNIQHYRQEELKRAILIFIKECRADYESVTQGKKDGNAVYTLYSQKSEIILEEYFRNGNGERKAVSEYLEAIIRNKGRLNGVYQNK